MNDPTTDPDVRPRRAASTERRRIPSWAERSARWAWAFIGIVAALALVVLALAALNELVVPLIVAAVAAVLFAPVVDWLERHRVPRRLAAGMLTLLVVAAAVAVVVVIVVAVADRSDELADQLDQAWTELGDVVDIPALDDIDVDLGAAGRTVAEGAGSQVSSLVGSAVGVITGLILALVLLYYLLLDGRHFVERWLAGRPEHSQAQARRILFQAASTIRDNARGRTALAAAQALFVFVVLLALGVPLPATIALVNFVGAFIPYLGAFVGGAFAVLVALSEGGMQLAVAALVAVVVMNVVVENLLEPRLIGSSMKMHPIIVLIATVAGGAVAGLLGLILAAPVVAIGTNVYRELRSSGVFPSSDESTTEPDPPDA
ncbi:AI-2E family transporter [Ilumatobacter nonamiensis]|uniref:AI-2E family transporter n=1 Tax=Ilumatobacter nonamiensis TaxID=467093 RepID=UPI00034646F3|nr:AI-2E family transporter [Ilumatobacter nonamiensis]